jgi:hypothetical protein
VGARGSIKEIERRLGISYPTVRARLERLAEAMGLGADYPTGEAKRCDVLDRLERGEITAEEAVNLIKEDK